jgi:hypothetical protein
LRSNGSSERKPQQKAQSQRNHHCSLANSYEKQYVKRLCASALQLIVTSFTDTIRRNVILRDEAGQCSVCVWGNHTAVLNEGCVGRPITFNRATVQEHEGQLQLSMPKDSSVALGATPKTNKIQAWLSIVGQTPISVLEAINLKATTVTCIHGILAKITVETVTLKTGNDKELTTIAIAHGPPKAFLYIQFWNANKQTVGTWDDMLHNAVNVNKVRCSTDERGNQYESIGDITNIVRNTNTALEDWWFKV